MSLINSVKCYTWVCYYKFNYLYFIVVIIIIPGAEKVPKCYSLQDKFVFSQNYVKCTDACYMKITHFGAQLSLYTYW